MVAFRFGPAARLWLSAHRIPDADITGLEEAVDADRCLARLARPPSLSSTFRRAARQAAKAAKAAKVAARGLLDGGGKVG